MKLDPGIYYGMSDVDYNAIEAMRWSTLRTILDSPLAMRHALDHPRKDTPAMRFGRAFHGAILGTASAFVAVPPAHLTPSGAVSTGKAAREWMESLPDETIALGPDDCERIESCCAVVAAHADASEWIAMAEADPDGGLEVVAVWIEAVDVDGVEVLIWCKAKADILSPRADLIADLKSHRSKTGAMSLRSVEGAIASYLYHAQEGFYARGFRDALISMGSGVQGFEQRGFIFASSAPPFDCVCAQADDDMVQIGDDLAVEALQRYARAVHYGEWPGCAPRRVMVSLPRWAMPRDNDDVAGDLGLTGLEG